MADSQHLEKKRKNCNISAIVMKFGRLMHLGPMNLSANKILRIRKSKMAVATILKNKKTQYLCNRMNDFWQNLKR